MLSFLSSSLVLIGILFVEFTSSSTSYINEFIDPDLILSGNFSNMTRNSQKTIGKWALQLAARGPWSVVNKTILPPSADVHDFMSWAPYTWPNCTNVGNTTVLTPQQVWSTCPYYIRDGIFNPDVHLLQDESGFQSLADAVLYNAMAWALSGKPTSMYVMNVVKFIEVWFLNPATKMNPNLNYAQMPRGPNGMIGSHTGILDLKCFTKIVTGILVLRKGATPLWTAELDNGLNSWVQQYVNWLETSPQAIRESQAQNNHGTFFYNQLASLKILIGDLQGAKNVTDAYFNNQFLYQIESTGEQPLEARRTRPYHYRNYNVGGMITNARLSQYLDPSSSVWSLRSLSGATIQTALDFVMQINPSLTNETQDVVELLPNVAAVAAAYGDTSGKYGVFLSEHDPLFWSQAYFLWSQPLKGGVPVRVVWVGNGHKRVNDAEEVKVKTSLGVPLIFVVVSVVFWNVL